MIQFERFNHQAQDVAAYAYELSVQCKHKVVDTTHMLLALLEQDNNVISRLRTHFGMDFSSLRLPLYSLLKQQPKSRFRFRKVTHVLITPQLKEAMEHSFIEANHLHDTKVSSEHLLLAITQEQGTALSKQLAGLSITYERVLAAIQEMRKISQWGTKFSQNELEIIRSFLVEQSTMALATVGMAWNPQVAPLFYVSDADLNLYWLSSGTSQHSINLAVSSQVAATIYPSVWGWQEIRGLQIEGRAGIVDDTQQREEILLLYRTKFTLPPEFDEQIAASTLYVLTPTWIRWLDNGVSFGHKSEVSI